MRASPAEYLALPLRAHDVMRDVPLYDVSTVDLPGGGAGRTVADVRAIESSAKPSRVANALYEIRCILGRAFGWDRVQMRPQDSLVSRLTERDRRDSEITPGVSTVHTLSGGVPPHSTRLGRQIRIKRLPLYQFCSTWSPRITRLWYCFSPIAWSF
jgi:hypothetical protein